MRCASPAKRKYRGGRLVDEMHGLAGRLPDGVTSISMQPAAGRSFTGINPLVGQISKGAYYFDEASCDYCVIDLTLGSGATARIAATIDGRNFSATERNISNRDVREGIAVKGSPFNAPERLAEGPNGSIWALDRLGNRVAVLSPGHVYREYDLPAPFADAGDIVATNDAIWVSERRVGSVVRFSADGSYAEFAVTHVENPQNFKIARGGDGRLWYLNQDQIGAVDASGRVTVYPSEAPVFWMRDLAAGSDGRTWFIGDASSFAIGERFLAAVDSKGRWERFPISQDDAVHLRSARSGFWVVGDYRSLSFFDMQGHERRVSLPIDEMRPRPYAIDDADNLWFSDAYGNVVARAKPDGSVRAGYSLDFGKPGVTDMKIDDAGLAWIADSDAQGIEEFDPATFSPASFHPLGAGVHPYYLLFDKKGNLWYSDPTSDVIGVLEKSGGLWCYALPLSTVKQCGTGARLAPAPTSRVLR
jgi:streptogramin lyase